MQIPDDPFILELLPEFLDTWMADVQTQMAELISSRNGQDLYRFGHTMKGSCAQFGLDGLSAMGIELMGYAKNGEWDKAAAMQKPIYDSFNEAKEFVEKHLNGA